MEEIDFNNDLFEDVVARDPRYHPRAYALLIDCVRYLTKEKKGHVSGEEVLEEFKERTLDQYGPMAYTVLTEWGLSRTEDLGEMMFNLTDSGRVAKNENDTPESFAHGYDFKEAFLAPYQT